LTKVFTSTLLADEVVNKNIKLKASVNKAFSFKFNDKIKLSYLDLSNHTSGMYRLPSNIMPMLFENPNNPYSQYSYDLFNDYLKSELQLDDNEVPKYTYSNLGAGLLAYALSNRKGQEFESLLKG
jgi:CubicO group peptidase (beta-lactamase class C family)